MKRLLSCIMVFAMLTCLQSMHVSADDTPYEVWFHTNGGTFEGFDTIAKIEIPKNVEMRVQFMNPEAEINDPTRGFAGWSFDDDNEPDFTPKEFLHFVCFDDHDLYATYDRAYKLTLDFGSGSYDGKKKIELKLTKGVEYDLSDYIPVIENYDLAFAGWSMNNDDVCDYDLNHLEDVSIAKDTTLHAIFTDALNMTFKSSEISLWAGDGYAYTVNHRVPRGYPCGVTQYPTSASRYVSLWSYSHGGVVTVLPSETKEMVLYEDLVLNAKCEDSIPVVDLTPYDDVHLQIGEKWYLGIHSVPASHSPAQVHLYSTNTSAAKVVGEEIVGVGIGSATIMITVENADTTIATSRVAVYVTSSDTAACRKFGFCLSGGKNYWYESWGRQGVIGDPKNIWDTVYGLERGREIYDPESDGWYWLDCIYDGAAAYNKEVWMPYIFQEDLVKGINKQGKWVRYNASGKMIKGWYSVNTEYEKNLYPSQAGNTYYYDLITGEMLKGWRTIDGKSYHFDELTGALKK